MELRSTPLLQRKLITVGLFVAGLLAGVLIMQLTQRTQRAAPAELRTVEFHKSVSDLSDGLTGSMGALQLNDQFKKVAQDVKRSVVSIHSVSSWYNIPCAILKRRSQEYRERESLGSGVLISPQGYIVTNYHLVEGACGLRVTFLNKEEYDAEVVGVDRSTDLAVIRVLLDPEEQVDSLPLGDSEAVQTGEWVLAVGNPLELTSTVTAGIVSALGRRVDIIDDRLNVEVFIQTDAAISPGNSGGALVNLRGELIGINTAIATQSGYNEGYGFAIPVNLVDRVARDLIAYGKVKRGYAGIGLENITASFARELGMDQVRGVYLNNVRREGAAYQAGLREGDVVLSVGDRPVNEPNELQSIIALHRPGDRINVFAWRRARGTTLRHVVTLESDNDPSVATWISSLTGGEAENESLRGPFYPVDRWGLVLKPLSAADTRLFGAPSGAYIFQVNRGGLADRAGVPVHVVLQKINGDAVASAAEAHGALQLADEAVLTLLMEEGTTVDVRLALE